MILPTKQVADLLGLSERRVNQLAREGIAVRASPGKFDAAATVQNYISHVAAKATIEFDSDRELARLRKEQADGQELKNAKTRGELLSADEVLFGWSHITTNIRLGVLAVVPRIAQELGLSPEHTRALEAELLRALTDLADDPLKSIGADDRESDGRPSSTAENETI